MRTLVKVMGIVLLLLALAQAALWYAGSRWFAGLAGQLQPAVELHYGSSFAWLNGRAGIRNVRVGSPMLAASEQVNAERASIITGGPLDLFSLFMSGERRWPDDAAVHIQRLRLTAQMERQLRDKASRLGYLAPFEALGCNPRGRFSGVDYAELGWQEAAVDIRLGWRHDRVDSQQLSVSYDMAPLGRLEMDLTLAGNAPSPLQDIAAAGEMVEHARVRFEDRGMIGQRNAYCARGHGQDMDGFHGRHMRAVRDELESFGVFLDEAVVKVYDRFARNGGQIELTLLPSRSIPLRQYHHYRPEDQLAMLGASLRYNEDSAVPISARFHAAAVAGEPALAAAEPVVQIRAEASAADEAEVAELPGLVGRRLSIRTLEQITYVGTLLGVEGALVRIENERGLRPQRVVLSASSISVIRVLD